MTLTQVTTGGVDENINIDSNTLKVDGTNNRVGIGTNSPSAALHLSETGASDEPTLKISSENGDIFLRTASSSGSFPTGGSGNDGELLYLGGDFRVGIGTASKNLIFMNGSSYQERARIDSSGRVGIGTTSPGSFNSSSDNLVIAAGDDNVGITLKTNSGYSSYISFTDTVDSTNQGYIGYTNPSDALVFATNTAERMRIDSSGNLGIGTTSPSSKLHVNGTITDSIGPIRRLGITTHNASTLTLAATHAGNLIREATNSANITLPSGVFSAGDMITIFNVSSGDNTITQGSGVTLYNTADAATGNRTLAAKGVCTIACTSSNEFIISGSGLS